MFCAQNIRWYDSHLLPQHVFSHYWLKYSHFSVFYKLISCGGHLSLVWLPELFICRCTSIHYFLRASSLRSVVREIFLHVRLSGWGERERQRVDIALSQRWCLSPNILILCVEMIQYLWNTPSHDRVRWQVNTIFTVFRHLTKADPSVNQEMIKLSVSIMNVM